MSSQKKKSCFDIGKVPRSPGKWNWNWVNFYCYSFLFLNSTSSFSGKAKRQTNFPPNLSSSSWPFFYFLFPRFCDNSIVSGRNSSQNGAKIFLKKLFQFLAPAISHIFLQFSVRFWSIHFIDISWNRNCKELYEFSLGNHFILLCHLLMLPLDKVL